MLYTRRFGLLVSTKMFQDSRDAAFLSTALGFSGAGRMLSWDGMAHRNGKYRLHPKPFPVQRPLATTAMEVLQLSISERHGWASRETLISGLPNVAKSKSSRFHSEVSKSERDSLVIIVPQINVLLVHVHSCRMSVVMSHFQRVSCDICKDRQRLSQYAKTIPVSFQFCSTKVIIQVCDYPLSLSCLSDCLSTKYHSIPAKCFAAPQAIALEKSSQEFTRHGTFPTFR